MNIHPIETGFFSTDGGAMFGIVSRKVWSGKYPVDDENRCPLAMRILFVDFGDHKVLFDTGVGLSKVHGMEYYKFHDMKNVVVELDLLGYKPSDITDVVLSHLHFDHCGGSVTPDLNGKLQPAFPKAIYWASKKQFNLTYNPSVWESDSYSPSTVTALQNSGQLRLIESDTELFAGVKVKLFQGHTDDQLVSYISTPEGILIYCGDVIPMSTHVMPVCIAAVDNSAEIAVDEKMRLLEEAVKSDSTIFFFHDVNTQAVKLKNIKGKITVMKKVSLNL